MGGGRVVHYLVTEYLAILWWGGSIPPTLHPGADLGVGGGGMHFAEY